ncbi:hypothetical protein D1Z97_10395 [Riemerella anatipestifer]|nr:hypothetical protein AWB57_02010 [Riemerella anatipestifer]MRM96299.1 hypothetical protein [Riemerella anatipestifer]MRN01567.1 hypothetical protein [Riemerella anatipestifer]MRN03706.1 hypothetical protein [Riemerella anatipestifer]MRN17002.1 hypothetical protein [Riemerella anatipestifer]
MHQEMNSKKADDLIVKQSDFLGFQKIKTDKTIENYKKAIKTNAIQILKNKTELESKHKQIIELKNKIESLKKEVFIFKSKNSALLTNENVFAVEKKKYLESVENTLKKSILQESIKIPNLQNLNDTERKRIMIEIIEKTTKANQIPISAVEEIFEDSSKTTNLFKLLNIRNQKEEFISNNIKDIKEEHDKITNELSGKKIEV